jgi:23S rRNA (cytosine1962-C5)-methyltransferase
MDPILALIQNAIRARTRLGPRDPRSAMQLFNGFLEGFPALQIHLFADTILLINHAKVSSDLDPLLPALQSMLLKMLPEVECIILKQHFSEHTKLRNGICFLGGNPASWIIETGTKYAIDLTLNQDPGFYLDTRNVRAWLISHAKGWKVLNTFAYTGSLGIAALAGGASHVVQTDRTRRFLQLAEKSRELNGFLKGMQTILPGDFFSIAGSYRRRKNGFDCVIFDPPYFSTSPRGVVDLQTRFLQLINKARPLVQNQGYLVAINNSLFLSGKDYLKILAEVCADGFLRIEELISIPVDATGFPDTIRGEPRVNPSPFNHSTKIAVLKVHTRLLKS